MHRDVAQLGSALRSGRRGRRFKSCHPDHDAEKASKEAFFVFQADKEKNLHIRQITAKKRAFAAEHGIIFAKRGI